MGDNDAKTIIGVGTDRGEKFSAQPNPSDTPTRSNRDRVDRSAQPTPSRSPRESDGGANTQPRPAPTPTSTPKPDQDGG